MEFDKMQIEESLSIYKHKNEVLQADIKQELQRRKELKRVIQEAKARYETQLQTSKRLNEYEKFLYKELENAKQAKDDESISMVTLIKEYDEMLRIQENVWDNYKSQYEQFPMAIEVKTKRRDLMKLKIECGILLQNSKVQQRIEEQRKDFQKKKERVQLIRIAKLYKEYIEFEQNEKSQMQEIINVKNRIEQLKMETRQINKQLKNEENFNCKHLSGDQQPQLNLQIVKFTEYQHQSNYYMSDDISCNTLMLEEEFDLSNILDKSPQTVGNDENCLATSKYQSTHENVIQKFQEESCDASRMDIEEQRQTSPNAPLQKSPPRQQNQEKLSSATQHSNTIVTQKNQKRPPSKSFDSSDGQNNDNKKPKIIKEEIIKQQIVAKKVQLMSPIPANSIFSTRMETENSDSIDNVSEIMSEFEDPAAYYDFAKRVRGDSISSDFDISDGQPDFSGILTSPTPGINIPNMSPLPFHPKELKNAGKPSDSKDVNHNQQNNEMPSFMPESQGKRNTKFF